MQIQSEIQPTWNEQELVLGADPTWNENQPSESKSRSLKSVAARLVLVAAAGPAMGTDYSSGVYLYQAPNYSIPVPAPYRDVSADSASSDSNGLVLERTAVWPDSHPWSGLPMAVWDELKGFSDGLDGVRPNASVVETARRLAKVASRSVSNPDITVDIDGELSFYLRLSDGRLVLAELQVSGGIDASVFDGDDNLLDHMPEATAEDLISALNS